MVLFDIFYDILLYQISDYSVLSRGAEMRRLILCNFHFSILFFKRCLFRSKSG